jgi:hypothetical protein
MNDEFIRTWETAVVKTAFAWGMSKNKILRMVDLQVKILV